MKISFSRQQRKHRLKITNKIEVLKGKENGNTKIDKHIFIATFLLFYLVKKQNLLENQVDRSQTCSCYGRLEVLKSLIRAHEL